MAGKSDKLAAGGQRSRLRLRIARGSSGLLRIAILQRRSCGGRGSCSPRQGGKAVKVIAREAGVAKPTVWRWQRRFAEAGVDGLLRDKTRPPGRKPLGAKIKAAVLAKTTTETPPNATHWSVRTMAKAMGISRTSVQRIWAEAGIKPHLVKRFKVSRDPLFEEKVVDVVGLYMNPPDRALVLCVDEKNQIQALDRTQPSLPLKRGRAATTTHDYKQHGTTTLFAALDVRTGLVIGQCQPRHRAKEFIRFLAKIDRVVKRHLDVHLILRFSSARRSRARMASAGLVHTNGLGLALWRMR